jgi:ComF family protein
MTKTRLRDFSLWPEFLMSIVTAFFDFLYPPVCECCGIPLSSAEEERQHPFSALCKQYFCPSCDPLPEATSKQGLEGFRQAVPGIRAGICLRCGERAAAPFGNAQHCPLCEFFPPAADCIRSLLPYCAAAEQAIKAYKYAERRRLASFFGHLLADCIRRTDHWSLSLPQQPDAVVPLPSSMTTLQQRGFHHTALIAQEMGRQLRIPVLRFALRSARRRRAQASLPPQFRRANMKDAFSADARIIAGKKILLLDDLLTSGSSIDAAAVSLKQAGAVRVDAVTVARSVHFMRNRVSVGMLHKPFQKPFSG